MTGAHRSVVGALSLAAGIASAAPASNAEIEDLAFRTYLYARLGDKDNALEYGGRVLEQRPGHAGVLLALASLWESERDAERLVDTAERLIAVMPDSDQALFFKASADFLLQRYAQSRATLMENRRLDLDSKRPFPYHATLAAAAERAGDWRTAIYSHERVAEEGGAYEAAAANRRVYDDLLRKHRRVATLSAELTAAPERHRVFDLNSGYEANATVRTRLSVAAERRDTTLSNADGWNGGRRDRTSGRAGIEFTATPEWTVTTTVGADDQGEPDITLGVTRSPSPGTDQGLSVYRNLPAYDDAPYAIADIRRTGLTASYDSLFTPRTGCHVSGGPRSLHTAGDPAEDWGWTFSGEIYHHLRQRIPRFTPYAQTLWVSNPRNDSVAEALGALRTNGQPIGVDGTFDLQKAGLRTELPIKGRLSLTTDIYGGLSLQESGFIYGASAEINWRLRKTLSLRAYSGWDKGTVLNTFPYGIARAGLSANWLF